MRKFPRQGFKVLHGLVQTDVSSFHSHSSPKTPYELTRLDYSPFLDQASVFVPPRLLIFLFSLLRMPSFPSPPQYIPILLLIRAPHSMWLLPKSLPFYRQVAAPSRVFTYLFSDGAFRFLACWWPWCLTLFQSSLEGHDVSLLLLLLMWCLIKCLTQSRDSIRFCEMDWRVMNQTGVVYDPFVFISLKKIGWFSTLPK